MNTKTEEKTVTKTAAELRQEEREKIDVQNNDTEEKEEDKDENKEKEKEEKEEEKDETEGEKKEEGEAEGDEKEEEKEESVEDLKRTVEKLQKRVDKTTGKNKDLAKELADAKVKLEAKKEEDGGEVLTEADVEERASKKAIQIKLQEDYVKACNRIADAGTKIVKNFTDLVNNLAEEVAPVPSRMIGVLDELDNGASVLHYLINNTEEYEEIISLSPERMALRLGKLNDKVKPKQVKKEISKVPNPIDPISASGRTGTKLHSNMTDAEWIEQRQAEVADKRAKGRINLR